MRLILSSTNLTDRNHSSKGDNLLVKAAERKGLEARAVDPLKISYRFSNSSIGVYHSGTDISDTDIVLFRRTRGAELESYQFAKAMETLGATVVDPSESLMYPVSKLIPQILRGNKYAPRTLFIPNFSEQSLCQVLREFSFPIAVKPQNGTKARGLNILKSEAEARRHFKGNYNPSIVQEYLDIVSLMRILTIGGKSVGATHCTGTTEYCELSKAERIAEEIIKDNPALILGVDVAKTREGRYYVLECNRNPDFTLMPIARPTYEDRIIEYCLLLKDTKSLKKPKTIKDRILAHIVFPQVIFYTPAKS